ncbi:putative pentatricopeptide repeat-containing protein [Platanthera guangdongensis]|uniref:Pentatricopeptide repeat-containing protein n=1 Tax=Platanthera guangdongensis TaxID=2320717 RepID=A0ABR2MGR7_9ASPA
MSFSSLPIQQRIPNLVRHCTFQQLKQVHAFLISSSLARQPALPSLCIRRAAELGKTYHAGLIFSSCVSGVPHHILPWNALIRGSVQFGQHEKALNVFANMLQSGLTPNEFTYSDVFSACAALRDYQIGKITHCRSLKAGLDLIPFVAVSVFNLYSSTETPRPPNASAAPGTIDARKIFDLISTKSTGLWNKMISVYTRIRDILSARKLFDEMPCRDVVSWNTMLSGYVRVKEVERAKALFDEMPERNVFSWTSMVRALTDTGDLVTARKLFDDMPERNVVSWNCMLSSYTQSGMFKQAMDLFFQMQSLQIPPDGFTFVAALSSCAHLGALKIGAWIHFHLIGDLLQFGSIVGTAMIEMYAKCGDINSAFRIFIKTAEKDVFCWNVMIKALAAHGRAKDALRLFASMSKEEQKLKLNDFTFMSVLFACSHGGLVEQGRQIFESMERDFNIKPTMEHYGCLIDLLCRSDRITEAYQVVKEMPYEPDFMVWGALLGGCRAGNDISLAEKVMESVQEVDDEDESGVYAMMSNVYATSSRWCEAQRAREKIMDRRIWKTPGFSSVVDASHVGKQRSDLGV